MKRYSCNSVTDWMVLDFLADEMLYENMGVLGTFLRPNRVAVAMNAIRSQQVVQIVAPSLRLVFIENEQAASTLQEVIDSFHILRAENRRSLTGDAFVPRVRGMSNDQYIDAAQRLVGPRLG